MAARGYIMVIESYGREKRCDRLRVMCRLCHAQQNQTYQHGSRANRMFYDAVWIRGGSPQ